MIVDRFDLVLDELNAMYTNMNSEELANSKGFVFLTEKKYLEVMESPSDLKIQIKELQNKIGRSDK